MAILTFEAQDLKFQLKGNNFKETIESLYNLCKGTNKFYLKDKYDNNIAFSDIVIKEKEFVINVTI